MTRPSGRIVPLIVAVAFFMENFDGTAIATALPTMAASFGVHAVDLSNGITAYLVTLAVFIPVSGWCADRLAHVPFQRGNRGFLDRFNPVRPGDGGGAVCSRPYFARHRWRYDGAGRTHGRHSEYS